MLTAARSNKSITSNVPQFCKISPMILLLGQGSAEVELEFPVELPESRNTNVDIDRNLEQGPELRRSGRAEKAPVPAGHCNRVKSLIILKL